MTPPKNTKVIEWPTSTMWFDEDGILYSIPKPGAKGPQTKEEALKQMDMFRRLINGKKVCMIAETDRSGQPPRKEDRDWIARELNSVVKALGIISTSPLGKMVANLFFGFKPPAYSVKFFSNETEAKEWIKQYL